MSVQIGTIRVRKDFDSERSGETACNYTVTRVKAGEYPVFAERNATGIVLVARCTAWLMHSHYVNRVFTSSSVNDKHYEEGERGDSYQWRWGDYDRFCAPPTALTGGKFYLTLNKGWKVTADYRGNYEGGGPLIRYDVVEDELNKE